MKHILLKSSFITLAILILITTVFTTGCQQIAQKLSMAPASGSGYTSGSGTSSGGGNGYKAPAPATVKDNPASTASKAPVATHVKKNDVTKSKAPKTNGAKALKNAREMPNRQLPVECIATKNDGSQCKRLTYHYTGLCWEHREYVK